jgi:hypothetical protein
LTAFILLFVLTLHGSFIIIFILKKIFQNVSLKKSSGSSNSTGIASPNRRGFRPAWSKDGGTFGTPKAADAAGASSDFGQLSLSGPGGPVTSVR